MRNYELTVILPGKATPAKKKAAQEKVEKAITDLKGKVGKVEELGEIDLTYKIKKETSGIFLHFALELEAKGAKALADTLKMESEIIRYLLIRAGE